MLIRRHPSEIIQLLPKRNKDSHKGTFGKLLLIAGSNQYTGAASLMTEAALRSGVGLLYIVCTHLTAQVIRLRCPEAIVIEVPENKGTMDRHAIKVIEEIIIQEKINNVGIGPGLGRLSDAAGFYDDAFQVFKQNTCQVVIDADALEDAYQWVKMHAYPDHQLIFTPHPKEFLRMINQVELVNENKDVLKQPN